VLDPAGARAGGRAAQADSLRKRLPQIDAAENAHAREIEALVTTAATATAITALRTRIIARFIELEEERATINTQLVLQQQLVIVCGLAA